MRGRVPVLDFAPEVHRLHRKLGVFQMEAEHGHMTLEDLRDYTVTSHKPIESTFRSESRVVWRVARQPGSGKITVATETTLP